MLVILTLDLITDNLHFRSSLCVFLGYLLRHKGYRCLNAPGRVFVARAVVFNDNNFPYQQLSTENANPSSHLPLYSPLISYPFPPWVTYSVNPNFVSHIFSFPFLLFYFSLPLFTHCPNCTPQFLPYLLPLPLHPILFLLFQPHFLLSSSTNCTHSWSIVLSSMV